MSNRRERIGRWLSHFNWRIGLTLGRYLVDPARNTFRLLLSSGFARFLAFLAMLALVWELTIAYRAGDRTEQLYLLLTLFGVIVFIQVGDALYSRLKKVGPIEFFAEEARPFLEARRDMEFRWDEQGSLPPGEEFKYQQAEAWISNLQVTNPQASSLPTSHDLNRLLFATAFVAFKREDWARVINRLELLIRISKGSHKPWETYFRCSLAYLQLADSYKKEPPELELRRDLFRKAVELTEQAIAKYKDEYHFYFFKAYALDELGACIQAIENNQRALELSSEKFASAKCNKAISQVKLKWYRDAFKSLEDLEVDDVEIAAAMRAIRKDPELEDLRQHDRERMKKLLEKTRDWPRAKS